MTEREKEFERLKRERNLFKLDNDAQFKKLLKLEQENSYLKKRDKTLTALENSIPQRIKAYQKKNAPNEIIMELEFWQNILLLERQKLLKGEEDETEQAN